MAKQDKKKKRRRQEKDARARISYMRKVYKRLRTYLDDQIDEILPVTTETPRQQVKKFEELQTIQVSLMKAEEEFDEKFQPEHGSDVDYDALRAQIGRALDRLRESERSVKLLEDADQSAT